MQGIEKSLERKIAFEYDSETVDKTLHNEWTGDNNVRTIWLRRS